MTNDTSLDDLFREAKAAMRTLTKERSARKLTPMTKEEEDQIGLYRNPANWIKGRAIALIHLEIQSLLGNFTEYTHKTDASARKLVREAGAPEASCVEYVSGDWWMLPTELPKPRRLWKESKLVTLPLVMLLGCGVHAKNVSVYASFGEGVLERIDLAEETIFGGGSCLITLAADTDILLEVAPSVCKEVLIQLDQPT